MSLRWRWALSIAALSILAVAATTAIGLVSTERELRAQVDHDLLTRFQAASRAVPAAPPRGPFDRSDRDPFEVRPDDNFDTGDLVGLDAAVQVTIGGVAVVPGDPTLPARGYDELGTGPRLETVEIDGESFRMISGRVQGPRLARVERVVQVAIAVESIDSALELLLGRLAVAGLGLAAAAGTAGWFLARSAVRPIEQLTKVTDTLAASVDTDLVLPVDAPGEVGQLSRSFGSMVESLRSSRDQQQRLVADAGHEFRTPLTALVTNIDTLLRRDPSLTPEQRRELLEAAAEETTQLSTLATELVDLATDAALRTETSTDIDLGELALAVADRYTRRTGLQIIVRGESDTVIGRANELERAISNLVDNAVKWSDPAVPIEIVLEGRTLTVADRGPGIPEADLPRVFERFHRSIEARSTAGSGLGLAIVEHIVTAHGGTVFARNREGGGAEVGFVLR